MHDDFTRDHAVKGSSDRGFGLVFAGFFLIVGLGPLISGGAPRWWALGLSLAFALVALAAPALLAPANRLWTRVGMLLHRIVNPVVTGLLFFVVVTPTGLLMRVFGKDPLRLRWDRQAASYWIERQPPGPPPDTMSRQF